MRQLFLRAARAAWRLLPAKFRRRALTNVSARMAPTLDWPAPAQSQGVVVAGDVEGANGLAESARILHQVIHAHGLARGFIPLGLPSVVPAYEGEAPKGAALLAVVNAPVLPVGLLRLRRDFIKGRRVIGMWAWELPVMPEAWRVGAAFAHEIWAPSPFTATAIEKIAPGRVRFVPYPLAEVALPAEGTRASFGLPDGVFIVLTIFNLASSMVRKNPLGAIAAFKAAFGDSPDHLFVMKISGIKDYPEDLAAIQTAIGNSPNIRLMSETLPEPQLRGLMMVSDVVMSLHRSEGFGLIPATAMLLGRPVVATGWSGNLAFMTPESGMLVDYDLIPVDDPRGVYDLPEAAWAEPRVADAAAKLAALAADAGLRARLAAAGQMQAREALGAAPVLAALAANNIL